jgi:hypothetical protein
MNQKNKPNQSQPAVSVVESVYSEPVESIQMRPCPNGASRGYVLDFLLQNGWGLVTICSVVAIKKKAAV